MADPITVADLAMLQPPLRPTFSRMSSRSSGRKTNTPTAKSVDNLCNISAEEAVRSIVSSLDHTSDIPRDEDRLVKSFDAVSTSEKAFAMKVARSLTLVKEWCKELERWQWSGTFEAPQLEQEHEDSEKAEMGIHSVAGDEYLGSLPKRQVMAYEDRLDEIFTQLEFLDIEELKSRTLKNVLRTQPAEPTPEYIDVLDELINLTTSIVLQALPFHTRLVSTLESWSARIVVLQQVPGYLRELEECQRTREKAWLAIGVRVDNLSGLRRARTMKTGSSAGLVRESFDRLRDGYEDRIAVLGQRIDTMLDILEGREETLPEKWIDAVEELEIDYSSWTVEAGRKVLRYESSIDVNSRPQQQQKARRLSQEQPSTPPAKTPVEQELPQAPGAWNEDAEGVGPVQAHESKAEYEYPPESPHDITKSTISAIPSPNSLPYRSATPSGFFPRVVSTDRGSASGTGRFSSLDAFTAQNHPTAPNGSTSPRLRPLRMLANLNPRSPHAVSTLSDPFKDDKSITSPSDQKTSAPDITSPPKNTSSDRGEISVKEGASSVTSVGRSENPRSYALPKRSSTPESDRRQWKCKDYAPESLDASPTESPPLLRVPIIKRRTTSTVLTSLGSSSTLSVRSISPRTPSALTGRGRDPAADDHLERLIGKVLKTLPARFKFEKEAYVAPKTSTPTSPKPTRSSKKVEANGNGQSVGLIIVPAYQKETRSSKLNSNSEIKLFYLIDGNRNPMKLFVRFVGESGRVVVRVGGGWADLAEYLREYANHHGRAISPQRSPARNTQLQGNSISRNRNRSPERLSILPYSPTPITTPTRSSFSPTRVQPSTKETLLTSPTRPPKTSQPLRRSHIPTPTASPKPTRFSPPAPTTPTRAPAVSPRKPQDSDGLGGLMGPAVAGRSGVSPEKEKWVYEMIAQVQTGSPSGFADAGGDGGGFEGMGRVGGTRRLHRVGALQAGHADVGM